MLCFSGIILMLLLSSCSSILVDKSGIKNYNLGKASDYDISTTLPRLLRKYQYDILKTSGSSDSYKTIETEWKQRYPLQDEQSQKIKEGRTRLIFRIRKASDNLSFVQMEVENMIINPTSENWISMPMSKDLAKEIRHFATEVKRKFSEGRLQ